MPTTPSLRRRRLAAELRKLRDQSGLGVTDVAGRLEWQLSFDAGVHPAMMGPFTMMTFPDPDDLGLVNVENATGALFLEETAELRAYDEIWGSLQASALSPDDSQTFLRSTSFGYRTKEGMK